MYFTFGSSPFLGSSFLSFGRHFEILIINNVNGACHEMKEDIDNNWFETWFDSPYYHILYQAFL
jgi:hypothetical protein